MFTFIEILIYRNKTFHYIKSILSDILSLFKDLGLSNDITYYLYSSTCIATLLVIAIVLHYISKFVFVKIMEKVSERSATYFDDILVHNKTHKYVALLVPIYFMDLAIPIILKGLDYWDDLFQKAVNISMVFLTIMIIRSILRTFRDYLKTQPRYSDKPIDSFTQIIMIGLYITGIIILLSKLFEIDQKSIFTTFGAISAVALLIFRDPLLGFVASVQVASNDMVRIGDWITMERYGADGDVIEINLTTVKVKNFNNTITTIPTYSLISDSFFNWRGMTNSGGRRIKRHVLIKAKSIRFLTEEDFEELNKIQLIRKYAITKKEKIQRLNLQHEIDTTHPVNGMTMTNLGMFRKYLTKFLESHSAINKDMTLLVHQLQHIPQGIPLEIYCFCKDKNFENFESIVSGIFEHVFVSVSYFGLEIFELPTQAKTAEPSQPAMQDEQTEGNDQKNNDERK